MDKLTRQRLERAHEALETCLVYLRAARVHGKLDDEDEQFIRDLEYELENVATMLLGFRDG